MSGMPGANFWKPPSSQKMFETIAVFHDFPLLRISWKVRVKQKSLKPPRKTNMEPENTLWKRKIIF